MQPPVQGCLSLPAPAKLNLMLHIVGQRDDGYHELQTLFQFLDYADYLHFNSRTDGLIQLQTPIAGVLPHDNLIVKAAKLLQQHTGCSLGADIWLEKNLPIGGGVGGGSSNAATTLLGLNHLWHLGLSLEQLAELGVQLGADVPVFVHGKAAFAEGIGEKLTFVELAEPWYLVAKPAVFISTAKVFNDPGLTRDSAVIKVRTVLEQGGRNDCQAVVVKHYPEVGQALALLEQYTQARLTGTGSCVFGVFPNELDAVKISHQLSSLLDCFVAKGSNVSLLHKELQNKLER